MSTLVSYLLAAILQFLSVELPPETNTITHLATHQCVESTNQLPYSFIINNEQEIIK